MGRILIQKSEMSLRLAQILFDETQPGMKLEWFEPLSVSDEDEFWFVSGTIDPHRELPPDAIDNQIVNQTFSMRVKKADAEVADIGVSASIKMSPEVESHVRAALQAKRESNANVEPDTPSHSSLWLNQFLHGGIINSKDAAIQFAQLILENYFPSIANVPKDIRADLVDGIWRVSVTSKKGSTDIAFRRMNAQVTSLGLRAL